MDNQVKLATLGTNKSKTTQYVLDLTRKQTQTRYEPLLYRHYSFCLFVNCWGDKT